MKNYINKQVPQLLAPALLALVPFSGSQASEYSFDYSVEGGYEYDSNVGLRADDKIDIHGGLLTLPLTLTRRTERLELTLEGAATSTKFDKSDFDSNDQNVNLDSTYQLERGELSGYAGYSRDSTRTTEFLDTGFVGQRATRVEKATVGGSTQYMFTEKNGVDIGVDYRDVEYDARVYSDHDYISGNFGWRHRWREQTSFLLQGIAGRYENDDEIEVTSDSIGVQTGFETQLSEALNGTLLVGWANVDTKNKSSGSSPERFRSKESDDVFEMNGRLRYRQERYDLSAEARSGTRPSGDGTLNENYQLDLRYRYRVTERSNLNLSLVGGSTKSLEDEIDNKRDYARGRFRLDYRITESWYVAGTYVYSFQDRKNQNGNANSNEFQISLIFDPEEIMWSR